MSDIKWDKEKQAKGIELIQTLGIRPGTRLPDGLNQATVQHLFGDIWQRDGLELQERSMITCAALIALGRYEEQLIHFRGALKLGIAREKIEEMITHLAHYGGWPVAVGAVRSLAAVLEELEAEAAAD